LTPSIDGAYRYIHSALHVAHPNTDRTPRKSQLLLRNGVHIIEFMKKKDKRKDPAAVSLGRRGGARSRINLTPEQRSELGRRAAVARWGKPEARAKRAARKPKP
jgi:hypothetical protein